MNGASSNKDSIEEVVERVDYSGYGVECAAFPNSDITLMKRFGDSVCPNSDKAYAGWNQAENGTCPNLDVANMKAISGHTCPNLDDNMVDAKQTE